MSLHPNGCQHDGYKALNAARAPDVQPYYCGECLAIHLSEGVEEEMKAEINGLRERVKELEQQVADLELILDDELARERDALEAQLGGQ